MSVSQFDTEHCVGQRFNNASSISNTPSFLAISSAICRTSIGVFREDTLAPPNLGTGVRKPKEQLYRMIPRQINTEVSGDYKLANRRDSPTATPPAVSSIRSEQCDASGVATGHWQTGGASGCSATRTFTTT